MSATVRVGGTWLATIAAWGELEWSHAADGGCKEASWRMDLPPTFSHPSLSRPALVEIKEGANLWQGVLTEPDIDDDWTFHALGLSALGKDYLCFDASLNTTSVPNTAVDRAIIRGLPWRRTASLSATAFAASDQTASLNNVGDLMDAWSTEGGKRWGVDENAEVYARVDPTTPTWHLTPGLGRFGLADDEYASDLFGRYLAAGAGYATVTVGDAASRSKFGRREAPVDLTTAGLLSSGQATTKLNGVLAKGKARQGYTNGLEVNKYQLTTPGGQPAHLAFVKAGQMIRQHGVVDEQGQPMGHLDWVIGESTYQDGADTIALTPVGLVARDFESVLSGAL